ncbi:MAG: WD40 repeat domain-containing protein, partial [Spirochaetia bacterium]
MHADPQLTVQTGTVDWEVPWIGGRSWVSPDGGLVAVAEGPVVALYGAADGRLLRHFRGEGTRVRSVAFASDSRSLLFGTAGHTLARVDLESGDFVWNVEMTHSRIHSLAVSPNGEFFLAGTHHSDPETDQEFNQTHFGSFDSGELIWSIDGGAGSDNESPLFFLSNGRHALSKVGNGFVLLDLVSRRPIRSFEASWGYIGTLALAHSGEFFASAGAYATVLLWDLATGDQMMSLDAGDFVYTVAISPDERYIAAGTRSAGTRVFDRTSEEEVAYIPRSSSSLRFTHDGEHLVSGSSDGTEIWDWRDERLYVSLDPQLSEANDVALSPDGTRVYVAADDAAIHVWDTGTLQLITTLRGHNQIEQHGETIESTVHAVELSPDGTHILTAGIRNWSDRVVQRLNRDDGVSDLSYGRTYRSFRMRENTVILSSDGNWLLNVGSRTFLYDYGSGDLIQEIEAGEITEAAFAPDELSVFVGLRNGELREVDLLSGRQQGDIVAHTQPVTGIQFFPDGRRMLTSTGDGTIRIHSLADDELIASAVADAAG